MKNGVRRRLQGLTKARWALLGIVIIAGGCEERSGRQEAEAALESRLVMLAQNVDERLFTARLPWMPADSVLVHVHVHNETRTALFTSKSGFVQAADQAGIRRHTGHPDSTSCLSVSFFEKIIHPEAEDFKCVHWDKVSLNGELARVTTFRLKNLELLKVSVPAVEVR